MTKPTIWDWSDLVRFKAIPSWQRGHCAVQVKPTSKVKEEQTRANSIKRNELVSGEENSIKTLSNERRIAIRDYYTSGSFQELDQQVKSMMKQSQNKTSDGSRPAYICQVCGKEGHNSAIRNHIESHHLEGVSLPCNLCKKVFRSRHNLRRHNCEKREEFSILHWFPQDKARTGRAHNFEAPWW